MTSLEFKQKCIEMRKNNFTLDEIVVTLKRPKTSIFFHIKNISKSKILKEKIRDTHKRFALLNINRGLTPQKGKSWKGRHCKSFKEWTPALVNLVAHSMFDGRLTKTDFTYYNSNLVLIENFKQKIKNIYEHEPRIYKTPEDVIRLAYFSVELANLLKEKQEELLNQILTFGKIYQREFLKAFFDDEGCVAFNNGKKIVRGYQYNDKILYLVQKLLENFHMESKVSTRFHEIIISRRENLEKFAKEINFSTGLKVNGNRSNSIWKRDLEKREILRMALASYL